MLINNLKAISFRNFKSAEIYFDGGVNVLYGQNGSGKSNILEAIFVLLLGRSPRGSADAVMVKENAGIYRLEGGVEIDGRQCFLAVAYQTGGRKKITIDKVGARAAELFEISSIVSAAPGDLDILSGPPSKRREFLNIYLSQASPQYLANLSDYHKALEQKNSFLKQDNNGTETPFDDLLVKYGSLITLARKEFLDAIATRAIEHYAKISSGQKLEINYIPSVHSDAPADGLPAIEKIFYTRLERYKERERILQTSLVGPHRDEVDFLIGAFPARTHGSQGELRTAAISLKLAVFEYLRDVRQTTPILLLDEIFAELDDRRRHQLIESFGQFGQLFLTTAGDVPRALAERGKKFRIENGTVYSE